MGVVWLAWDRELLRHVALKVIHAHLGSGSDLISRFEAEAQATAQLQHPSIVPVHDVGHLPDGRPFYTMRVVTGQDLHKLIDALNIVSTRARWGVAGDGRSFLDLCDAFQQVCEAVAWAHSRGVVHRDLKPSNVMVGDFGQVLVVDWGLAKVVGSTAAHLLDDSVPVQTSRSDRPELATRFGRVSGSPGFMAPEQARGDVAAIGPRSDVFALGGILFTLLAGRPPAPDEEPASALAAFPRIDQTLRELCVYAMEPDPADRPADAAGFAERFGAWRRGARKAARQASVASRTEGGFRALSPELRAEAPGFLTRLVGPEGDARPSAAEAAPASVIEALERAGIIVLEAGEARLIDPSLPRKWDRLRGWVEGDRGRHQQLHLLIEAARGWEAAGAPARMLWSDAAVVWEARRMTAARTDTELAFLDASERLLRRHRVRRRVLGGAVSALVLGAAILSSVQWRAASQARDDEAAARQAAEARTLVSQAQKGILSGNPLAAAVTFQGAALLTTAPGDREQVLQQARTLAVGAQGRSAVVAAHRTQVESVDWSPSGHRVVTGDREGVVRIWSPDTLETFHDIDIGGGVKRIRWSPRGDTIATANIDGGIQVYSPETGSLLATLPSDQGWRPALKYLPDGRLLTSTPDGRVLVVRPDTGAVLTELVGHEHYVFDADFYAAGRQLATASTDMTVRIWDLDSGTERLRLEHQAQMLMVRHALDGQRVVAIGTQHAEAWLWDVGTGELIATLSGHKQPLTGIRVSPDGRWLITASMDESTRVWDARDGELVFVIDAAGRPGWSPAGRLLALGGKDGVTRIYDAHTGARVGVLPAHPSGVTSAKWSPDGARLLTGASDGTVRVTDPAIAQVQSFDLCAAGVHDWDLSEDQRWLAVATIDDTVCIRELRPSGISRSVAGGGHWVQWSHIGDRVAYGTNNGVSTISHTWRIGDDDPRPLLASDGTRTDLVFLEDDSAVVGISESYTVDVIDVPSGTLRSKLSTGHRILFVDMAGGRALLWNHDHTTEVWDLSSERRLARSDHIDREGGAQILGPQGTWVAWETERGRVERIDLGASGESSTRWAVDLHASVVQLQVDPSGRWLAGSLNDSTVVLLDAETGETHLEVPAPSTIPWLRFSPGGERFVLWSPDGTLDLRSTLDGTLLLRLGPGDAGAIVGGEPLASGDLLTISRDGTARIWPVAEPPPPPGALTNQRVCPNGEVHPLAPWPDPSAVWAPDSVCDVDAGRPGGSLR